MSIGYALYSYPCFVQFSLLRFLWKDVYPLSNVQLTLTLDVESEDTKSHEQVSPWIRSLYIGKRLIFGIFRLCSPCFHVHPNKLSPLLNHLHYFSFSVVQWCFRTSKTVLKYIRSFSAVHPYSSTLSTMVFGAKFSAHTPYLMCSITFVDSSSLLKMLGLHLVHPYAPPSIAAFCQGWRMTVFIVPNPLPPLSSLTIHIDRSEILSLWCQFPEPCHHNRVQGRKIGKVTWFNFI